ncbi:MAG TPA: hypothetical protein VFH63_06020 [candidate division Zixibacteria bacterium]|nr:hypothetical protein [candidate division Zixibacteria bacterium]
MSAGRAAGVLAAVVVVAMVAVVAYLVLRPPVRAAAGAVTIECAASVGLDPAACAAWGRRALDGGAPSNTFELEDVARISVERELLGFGSACRGSWFVERYPDDPVWTEEVPCP